MCITAPTLDPDKGWRSKHQPQGGLRAGKRILQHPDIGRIDREVMRHFLPDLDMDLPRAERFGLVCSGALHTPRGQCRPTLIMMLEVMPQEWFDTAVRVGEFNLAEAIWAQTTLDPEIPF